MRRAAVSAAVAAALAVVATAAGVVLVNHDDRPTRASAIRPTPTVPATGSARPTPTPTHGISDTMTPREVVRADNARLLLTGVSADDPDFRLSVWEAECTWCPDPVEPRGLPTYYALAITTDGYATTTYRRPRFNPGYPLHVESPGPGLLLVIDAANGAEWLVRDDGTVTRLARVVAERRPADPRRWHICADNHDIDYQLSWCALDPAANAFYAWEGLWRSTNFSSQSIAGPGASDEPWGLVWPRPDERTPPAPVLVAYWYVDGIRHTRDFGPATTSGEVHNLPLGVMSFWALDQRAGTLTIFSSDDRGASWQTAELRAPVHSRNLDVSRTPGGGLLALQGDAFFKDGSPHEGEGIRIWRAPAITHGSLKAVYESRRRTDARGSYAAGFSVAGARIWSGGLWSDDDGRTWSPTTWR